MAYTVMTLCSYGLHNYGLYSYGETACAEVPQFRGIHPSQHTRHESCSRDMLCMVMGPKCEKVSHSSDTSVSCSDPTPQSTQLPRLAALEVSIESSGHKTYMTLTI